MHLAILITNTDDSAFAHCHPLDDKKFQTMIQRVRPSWTTEAFWVKDGVFPEDLSAFDGVMITGSPASVHDPDPWVTQLLELIREAYAKKLRMFGACYGHQAIALALGGTVAPNAAGWIFGLTTSRVVSNPGWLDGLPSPFGQYGAHVEEVTTLPQGAEVITASKDCAVTGFCIGCAIFTTQNHPEMSDTFIAALIQEYQSKLPEGVGAKAQASLASRADNDAYGETIALFFER